MALDSLPHEVAIAIAANLSDKDVCALASVCKPLHQSIALDSSPLWRTFFNAQFDALAITIPNNVLRAQYQQRKAVLVKSRFANFTDGRSTAQKEALMILRDLLLQSYNGITGVVERSKNISTLYDFCRRSELLDHVLEPRLTRKTNLLMAVQILLAHLSFDLTLRTRAFGFLESQIAVYAPPRIKPIFVGRDRTEVNLEWVLNALNFFKYYLTSPTAALEHEYKSLENWEKVQCWKRPLKDGATPLGKEWRGAYAYLDSEEIDVMRSGQPAVDMEDRWCDSDDVFQTFTVDSLHAPYASTPITWPACFERHLQAKSHPSVKAMYRAAQASYHKSHPSRVKGMGANAPQTRPKTTRAQLKKDPRSHLDRGPERSIRKVVSPKQPARVSKSNSIPAPTQPILIPFQGSGKDEENFLAAGYTSALPAQHGIPGWQRFTMMKFFAPEDLPDGDPMDLDLSNMADVADAAIGQGIDGLWAYEGVVLPGGNVIVGRWWSPGSGEGVGLEAEGGGDDVYSGPFVWWCVD